MTTVTVHPFAAAAGTLAANAVAFRGAAESLDTLATPFARSVLATVLNGSSLDMAEQVVLAALGSPKGGAKGKPLSLSGIARPDNNVIGGAAIYQAWKAISLIVANLDADAFIVAPGTDDSQPDGTVGAAVIRPAVVAFVLADDGAAPTLRGSKGIEAVVRNAMAAHAKAQAALVAPAAASNDNASEEGDATPPVGRMSLTDRANAMLLAWNEASPEEKGAALDAISAMMAAIDADTLAVDVEPEAEAIAA